MRCLRRDEVRELLRQGHWPEASPAELRAHVESCRGCGETVLLTQGFRAAREDSAAQARLVPANLVWWRAQLRRRQAAMERVSKPIWGAQIFAALVTLCGGAGLVGWLAERGELSGWVRLALKSVGRWGLLPAVAAVCGLCLLGALAVYLTVERE